ncbi:Cytochrome c1 heme lyase, partial [Kickxella alabastrina]
MSSNSECTGDSCPVDFSSKKSATTCPVDHSSMSATNVATTALSSESEAVCPVDHNNRKTMEIFLPTSTIKEDRDEEEKKAKGNQGVLVNPDNQMPMVPEQQAHGGQRQTLSTQRVVSSIPRADRYAGPSECPSVSASSDETVNAKDNAPKGSNWVYPSEQMFFNAMRRKNWDPKEADMHSVVPIHNAVNEKCWMQILEWEK